MGLILISHDLNLVAAYCDRILVMNAGAVVEECAAGELAQGDASLYARPAGGDPEASMKRATNCRCSTARSGRSHERT